MSPTIPDSNHKRSRDPGRGRSDSGSLTLPYSSSADWMKRGLDSASDARPPCSSLLPTITYPSSLVTNHAPMEPHHNTKPRRQKPPSHVAQPQSKPSLETSLPYLDRTLRGFLQPGSAIPECFTFPLSTLLHYLPSLKTLCAPVI